VRRLIGLIARSARSPRVDALSRCARISIYFTRKGCGEGVHESAEAEVDWRSAAGSGRVVVR